MMLFAMVLTAGAIAGRGWNPTSRPPRTEQEEQEEEEARSIHWSPYDPVRVVDADP
jgi:hypothetical protein